MHMIFPLLENLLSKLGEIDTPVAPDMTAFGLKIFVGVALLVEVAAEVGILLIEEVGLTYGYPVKRRLTREQFGQLTLYLIVLLEELIEAFALVFTADVKSGREEADIVKHIGIALGRGKGMTATHGETTDSTVLLAFSNFVMTLYIFHDIGKTLVHRGNSRLIKAPHEGRYIHAF